MSHIFKNCYFVTNRIDFVESIDHWLANTDNCYDEWRIRERNRIAEDYEYIASPTQYFCLVNFKDNAQEFFKKQNKSLQLQINELSLNKLIGALK
jgi:hypothetical protein